MISTNISLRSMRNGGVYFYSNEILPKSRQSLKANLHAWDIIKNGVCVVHGRMACGVGSVSVHRVFKMRENFSPIDRVEEQNPFVFGRKVAL